jgi:hypothetical protein
VPEPTPSRENELAIALRDALAAAFAVHLSRNQGARDFARRVGLDKSLGWKVWRMSTAPSAAAFLRVFPKARGVRTLVETAEAKASPRALAEPVARLAQELLNVRADAARASAAADAVQTAPRLPRVEVLAQLARQFDVDSESLGFSIELRVGALMLVPDAASGRVSLAACTLIAGPRCYGAGVRAPVYMPLAAWEAGGSVRPHAASPAGLSEVPGFVPQLSTPGIAAEQFECFRRGGGNGDGPYEWCFLPRPGVPEVLAFLETMRGAGNMWAAAEHDFAFFSMAITSPMRRAVLDIWVHRSMQMPDVTVSCRTVQALLPHPGASSRMLPSPFPDGVLLECRKPGFGPGLSEADGHYRALLERGAAELGTKVGEFRLLRASVPHPAHGACIVADWPLPKRP